VTLEEVMCVVSDLEGQALTATEDGWLREDLADMREKVRAAIESYARAQRRAALEEAAKAAREAQRHHDERCRPECKCADGNHIAMYIEALAGEEAAR
jgi:hypothetical protein